MIRGRAQIFGSGAREWPELLSRVSHDVYHRPEYHRTSGFGCEGDPYLFAYEEDDKVFLWPYLLTPIDGLNEYFDVTSVYGYSGPVGSTDPPFLSRAWRELLDHWRMQRAVSAFTRFHPILGNSALCEGLRASADTRGGDLRLCGSTVSIDLTLDRSEQVRRYQRILRQEIRQSHEAGFITCEDRDWRHRDDFVRLYRETMKRRQGRSEYLIDSAWVDRFREALGDRARLFVTTFEGTVAVALLVMTHGPFVHAHLTGINADLVAYSPFKVVVDDVREWGTAQGLQFFHLGGGLGGREDSLFQFKRRFSPLVHQFRIGCWILRPTEYRELEHSHRDFYAAQGTDIGEPDYFPVYRYRPPSSPRLSAAREAQCVSTRW